MGGVEVRVQDDAASAGISPVVPRAFKRPSLQLVHIEWGTCLHANTQTYQTELELNSRLPDIFFPTNLTDQKCAFVQNNIRSLEHFFYETINQISFCLDMSLADFHFTGQNVQMTQCIEISLFPPRRCDLIK